MNQSGQQVMKSSDRDSFPEFSIPVLNQNISLKISSDERLDLLLDKKLAIKQIYYEGNNLKKRYSFLSQIKNKSLEEVPFLFSSVEPSESDRIWNLELEELRYQISLFLGDDYLYNNLDPVVCFCFGVRRSEQAHPKSKMGKGCKSCVSKSGNSILDHYFKGISTVDWILFIDQKLKVFLHDSEILFEIISFQNGVVELRAPQSLSIIEMQKMEFKLRNYFREEVEPDLLVFFNRD